MIDFHFVLSDVVSVAQAIAVNFHLRMYKDVCVSIVDSKVSTSQLTTMLVQAFYMLVYFVPFSNY